jgi:DNA polymerase elongation subunit (family B)
MKGWILDVCEDNEKNSIVIWTKEETGSVAKRECMFFPSFYVNAAPPDLRYIAQTLENDPFITSLEYKEKRLWPGEPEQTVLKISLQDYKMLMKLAYEIDELGDFSTYELYNVDISIPFAYTLEKDILPMTFSEFDSEDFALYLREDIESIDYTIPELRSVELGVEVEGDGIPTGAHPISKLFLDDTVIEGSDEADMLIKLKEELKTIDPDLVYTSNGDSFLLPYLSH